MTARHLAKTAPRWALAAAGIVALAAVLLVARGALSERLPDHAGGKVPAPREDVGPEPSTVLASEAAADNPVIQTFPVGGPTQTTWKVQWAEASGKGLYITGAWFKRMPSEPYMRVIYDARLADIFVPYHSGSPRFFDLTGFNFGLVQATSGDAGCCGTLLGTPPVVVKEVRDTGMLWKDDMTGRRAQELVLWGTLDAANYNYIMEYGFHDDGTISFRLGATARNLPGRETESHMHDALWRIDMDLAGGRHDSAELVRHVESIGGTTASDVVAPFNGGVEGFADWDALEFRQVRIIDTQTLNGRGDNIGYDVIPMARGASRHLETFAHHDFWITHESPSELFYSQLPNYVSNTESITNADIVLWYDSPVHHLPRDEDGRFVSGFWQGVALVMWGGFDLRPRNLFEETPLHP